MKALVGATTAAAAVALLAWAAVPLLGRLELRGGGAAAAMSPTELWLLEVFTAGVLAVLLGLAALGGWWVNPRGVRDVVEREPDAPEDRGAPGKEDDAGGPGPGQWLVATGGLLLGIYFMGWLVTR